MFVWIFGEAIEDCDVALWWSAARLVLVQGKEEGKGRGWKLEVEEESVIVCAMCHTERGACSVSSLRCSAQTEPRVRDLLLSTPKLSPFHLLQPGSGRKRKVFEGEGLIHIKILTGSILDIGRLP